MMTIYILVDALAMHENMRPCCWEEAFTLQFSFFLREHLLKLVTPKKCQIVCIRLTMQMTKEFHPSFPNINLECSWTLNSLGIFLEWQGFLGHLDMLAFQPHNHVMLCRIQTMPAGTTHAL